MNKPERLPHPDFSHWLPASLRDQADDQNVFSPTSANEMREIEVALQWIRQSGRNLFDLGWSRPLAAILVVAEPSMGATLARVLARQYLPLA